MQGYEAFYGDATIDAGAGRFSVDVVSAAARRLIGETLVRNFEVTDDTLVLTPIDASGGWRVTYSARAGFFVGALNGRGIPTALHPEGLNVWIAFDRPVHGPLGGTRGLRSRLRPHAVIVHGQFEADERVDHRAVRLFDHLRRGSMPLGVLPDGGDHAFDPIRRSDASMVLFQLAGCDHTLLPPGDHPDDRLVDRVDLGADLFDSDSSHPTTLAKAGLGAGATSGSGRSATSGATTGLPSAELPDETVRPP